MMIGSGGAVAAARARGAWVLSPSSMGVGLLEFHQLDRMIAAGRAAARALLEAAEGDLHNPPPLDLDAGSPPNPTPQRRWPAEASSACASPAASG